MKTLLVILYFSKAISTQAMTLDQCNSVAMTIERTKPDGIRALCLPMGKENQAGKNP